MNSLLTHLQKSVVGPVDLNSMIVSDPSAFETLELFMEGIIDQLIHLFVQTLLLKLRLHRITLFQVGPPPVEKHFQRVVIISICKVRMRREWAILV